METPVSFCLAGQCCTAGSHAATAMTSLACSHCECPPEASKLSGWGRAQPCRTLHGHSSADEAELSDCNDFLMLYDLEQGAYLDSHVTVLQGREGPSQGQVASSSVGQQPYKHVSTPDASSVQGVQSLSSHQHSRLGASDYQGTMGITHRS